MWLLSRFLRLLLVVLQTSITLLWTLYELARHPNLQEELRAEVAAARAESQGDLLEMLKRIPLVKGALKETLRWLKHMFKTFKIRPEKIHFIRMNFCNSLSSLVCVSFIKVVFFLCLRLHPVAVNLQRYIAEDIIIQNYHIPAGVGGTKTYKWCIYIWVFDHFHTNCHACCCVCICLYVYSDSGPIRAVCYGKTPQGVFSSGAVSALSLAEDRDPLLQKSGLRLWAPSVFRTKNSWSRDATLSYPRKI